MSPKEKNTSIKLSIGKIKRISGEKGISTLEVFEQRYDKWRGKSDNIANTFLKKVWTGKKISAHSAKKIALFLDVSIKELFPDPSRNAGIELSAIKVQCVLAEKGIYTLNHFEQRYDTWRGDPNGSSTSTPRKVWTGKKIAQNRTKEITRFLGVSVFDLLPDSTSFWETLIYNPKRQEPFMTFHGNDPGQLGLVVFDDCSDNNNNVLDKYKLRVKCHLSLKGNIGDHYFIVLRSKSSQFAIIAPLSYDHCLNRHTGDILRYPQNKKTFSFDPQDGLGFRELIAIRIPHSIPFNARSNKTGNDVTLNELNSLASHLLLDQSLANKIAISSYAFILV